MPCVNREGCDKKSRTKNEMLLLLLGYSVYLLFCFSPFRLRKFIFSCFGLYSKSVSSHQLRVNYNFLT